MGACGYLCERNECSSPLSLKKSPRRVPTEGEIPGKSPRSQAVNEKSLRTPRGAPTGEPGGIPRGFSVFCLTPWGLSTDFFRESGVGCYWMFVFFESNSRTSVKEKCFNAYS